MGRRRKNSFLDDFVKVLGAIVDIPYGYIIGGILTLVLLGASELLLAPPSPEELGLYAPAIGNFTKFFQWFFRCLAGCVFIATLINLYNSKNNDERSEK